MNARCPIPMNASSTSSSTLEPISENSSLDKTLNGFVSVRSLSAKASIDDLIRYHNLDTIGLCETRVTKVHVVHAPKQCGNVALVYGSISNFTFKRDVTIEAHLHQLQIALSRTTDCDRSSLWDSTDHLDLIFRRIWSIDLRP